MKKLFKKIRGFLTLKKEKYTKNFILKQINIIAKGKNILPKDLMDVLLNLQKTHKDREESISEDYITRKNIITNRKKFNKKLKICILEAQKRGRELDKEVEKALKEHGTLQNYWNVVKKDKDIKDIIMNEKL